MNLKLQMLRRSAVVLLMAAGPVDTVAVQPTLAAETVTVNYELTIDLVVRGTSYTARGIWSADFVMKRAPNFVSVEGLVRGEALRVRTVDGETIYVLRRSPTLSSRYYGDFPRGCLPKVRIINEILVELKSFQGPCRINDDLPLLVAFTDASDPATAKWLEVSNPLADGRCPSICIISLTIARTRKPVSIGIEQELPWLMIGNGASEIGSDAEVFPRQLGGDTRKLHNFDFSTEVDWGTP